MRILVDPGSHHLLNVGDAAMLAVAAARVRELWPEGELAALTTAPELLAECCPGVAPVAAEGRYRLLEELPALAAPARAPSRLRRALARARLAATARRAGRDAPAATEFGERLLAADLLLLAGRGGLTDAFAEEADAVLSEIEIAARIGLPVALVGQGVGPLEDAALRARARASLPYAGLVAVREGRAAPALLGELGVPADRIAVTGDEAIAPALEARPDDLGGALGLSVRVAGYAGVAADGAERVGAAVRAAGERLGAERVAIPISTHPHEDDRRSLAAAGVAVDPRTVADPPHGAPAAEAIAAAGRCRVVVAGSYHAAVFALAQGVPAVGVAASGYYSDKLLGLRERFGAGCRVVALDRPEAEERIGAAIDELWTAAPGLRDELLAAAARQVALGRAAYARLPGVAAERKRRHQRRRAGGSGPTSGSGSRGPDATVGQGRPAATEANSRDW